MNTTAQATSTTAAIPPLAPVKSEATIAAHVATLNALRKAHNQPPIKAWKESKAKLHAAITKLRKTTAVEAIDNGKPKDDLAIPDFLVRKPGDKSAWADAPLKPSASTLTLKSIAISKPLTEEQKKIAVANKTQGKKKPKGERARYDWEAATEAAAQGKLPTPPDFTANTHKYYRPKLAEVVKMAKGGDTKGLRSFKINGSSTSPTAIKKYVACALKALAAKAKS